MKINFVPKFENEQTIFSSIKPTELFCKFLSLNSNKLNSCFTPLQLSTLEIVI